MRGGAEAAVAGPQKIQFRGHSVQNELYSGGKYNMFVIKKISFSVPLSVTLFVFLTVGGWGWTCDVSDRLSLYQGTDDH